MQARVVDLGSCVRVSGVDMMARHEARAPFRRACWVALALGVIAVAGCLQEASEVCGNGGVCPPGYQCVDPGATLAAGRICASGTCGNGRLDPGEVCDDGNNRSGDGCPADCMEPCGDGVLDPGEACDDGNNLDGDGCSADCKSLDSIFQVSPPMVSFVANEGDPLPDAVTVNVRLQLRNDSVLVGYAPGVAQPTWLSITDEMVSPTTAEFTVRVTDTSVVGERSASVRLTISHQNSTGLETFDLPVTYRVQPSDLAGQAMPAALMFTATVGATDVPSQPVNVTFNGERVALLAAPSWLTVSSPPDLATSPAPFTVAVNNSSFAAGTELSDEIVFETTRGAVQRTIRVPVEYDLVAPPALAIQASPVALGFTAIADGSVPAQQPVTVTFTGDDVVVVSAPSWLTVSGPADPTASPASFAISASTTSFAVGTVVTGNLVLATTRGSAQQRATVHLSYQLLRQPEIQLVAPYLGIAGRSGVLYAHGRGLLTGEGVTVALGDLALDPVMPDSDTQITLSYPPLPEGHYPVTLVDPSGIAPSQPELVIVAPSAFTYQAIDAPTPRTRLVYDAERQALYGVNTRDQQIEHFAYSNGTWSALPPHPVLQLTDITMAPGGRSLIAIAGGALDEISLTDGLFTPIERARISPEQICNLFKTVADADNGKIWLQSELMGSGFCPAYFYDMLDQSLLASGSFYFGVSAATGDGTRIYARSSTFSSEAVEIYDALTNAISVVPNDESGFSTISVSDDGSRVIANDSSVYNRSLVLTGNVPYSGTFATLASRDSTRAFVYVEDTAGARLDVYDLNGPLQPGALYPLLKSLPLPDRANQSGQYAVAMTSTLDDAVVFISGDGKLLVVPVN